MSLPPHILCASAWWWQFGIAPTLHHHNPRPRLETRTDSVEQIITRRRLPLDLIRITTREFNHLCALLFVKPVKSGNWRYSPTHRLVIFLYCIANYQPLRKASFTFGWSIASLQRNVHEYVERVLECLDDHMSRQCSSTCLCG